jgi:putative ABC transport system ATP-binding protein
VSESVNGFEPDAVVELRAATRIHGRGETAVSALREVDLRLVPGEFVSVMGPSGSGKSTLLHLAGALDLPTSGTVFIGGLDVSALSVTERAAVRRRHVGYVFQELNLVPSLTAIENVALPRELDGIAVRQAREEAHAALAEVEADHLARRFPDELSGGQQQRVAIARSLVGPRLVVLADEPTGALDSATGDTIMAVLRKRVDDGAAVLLVTHEHRHASWADRIVHLQDGQIVGETSCGPVDLTLDMVAMAVPEDESERR